jgi:hypothetical protein
MSSRYRALVVAAVILVAVTAGRPAFALPPVTWPDGTPTSTCAAGVIESFADGQLRGWTTTTCDTTPAGAAYEVMTYAGSGYIPELQVLYGPAHVINHFAIPYVGMMIPGARSAVCLAVTTKRVMGGPTPDRCVEYREVNGQLQSSPLSVTDPLITNSHYIPGVPSRPTCLTCLVDSD